MTNIPTPELPIRPDPRAISDRDRAPRDPGDEVCTVSGCSVGRIPGAICKRRALRMARMAGCLENPPGGN